MPKERGFTLVELMIAVCIIGILAAIALPQYGQLIRKSKEASTLGNIGSLRSMLSIYYADNEGIYPSDNIALVLTPKYGSSVPYTWTNWHGSGNTICVGPMAAMTDATCAYYYDNSQTESQWGAVVINCYHSDLKGRIWSSL